MSVRVLSFHAAYRCAHAGACCTANWPIPIEADRLTVIRAAAANGQLRANAADSAMITRGDSSGADPPLLAIEDGRCVFFDPRATSGSCAIHRALGHGALPLACRQFPRVSLRDRRGVSVALSAYCPTAAGMLDTDTPASIVVDPPAFPANGEYVGLEAGTDLPPLLRAGVLMDWAAWWEWERLAVDLVANGATSADDAMARVRGAVAVTIGWMPDDGPLLDRVHEAFTTAAPRAADSPAEARVAAVLGDVPSAWRPGARVRVGRPPDRVMRCFLASHAFANWAIYLGGGLAAWLESLDAAMAFMEIGCGVGDADLALRHLARA